MIEQAIAQRSVNLMGGLNSGVKVEAKEVDAPEMISIPFVFSKYCWSDMGTGSYKSKFFQCPQSPDLGDEGQISTFARVHEMIFN